MNAFQSLTEIFAVPSAAQGDATTYVLAFLSSTAVELLAVAFLISAFAMGGLRQLFRASGRPNHSERTWFRFDVLSLSKLVIPLACLMMTVWIYIATQAA